MSEKESQFGAAIEVFANVRRRETKYVNQHLRPSLTERRKTKHVDALRLTQVYTLYVVCVQHCKVGLFDITISIG